MNVYFLCQLKWNTFFNFFFFLSKSDTPFENANWSNAHKVKKKSFHFHVSFLTVAFLSTHFYTTTSFFCYFWFISNLFMFLIRTAISINVTKNIFTKKLFYFHCTIFFVRIKYDGCMCVDNYTWFFATFDSSAMYLHLWLEQLYQRPKYSFVPKSHKIRKPL